MPELLLKFVYSSYKLLQYFKDGVHRRKKIDKILVSDPDSECVNNVPHSLFVALPYPETGYACGSVEPLYPAKSALYSWRIF